LQQPHKVRRDELMDTAEAAFAATCEGSGVINAVAFGAIEALLNPGI